MSPVPKSYLYRRVVQAKLYIDANYSSSIDLDNIADEAAFSKFHFIRLFREIYGRTPHQYLIAVRIEKARLFLAGGRSVSEACTEVGFDSLSSFSGLFKRLTGATPSAFLREQQDRKQKIATQPLGYIPNCFAEAKGWK